MLVLVVIVGRLHEGRIRVRWGLGEADMHCQSVVVGSRVS